ncbi:acyl carrier protein (plasmid) [Streptomyces sp. NBC_01136]|uniref:acyl carrier protein n=1 Tax=unclassified Streptomyces TaxID=2593676 RepID=UPI002F90DDA3|nr:acyl carrier protein [Streptomyces sp. NBC_01136]
MEFTKLVAELFAVDPASVRDTDTPAMLPGWTSLKHMELVATLEEAYAVRFSVAEIKSFTSVGNIRAVLEKKGVRAVLDGEEMPS